MLFVCLTSCQLKETLTRVAACRARRARWNLAVTLFRVSAGVKVTLSALIDGKNFNAGGHKVGMGFELEA